MAMGGFQRNRGYNQENAMSGLGALSKLLGQQSDSFQQVGDSVEEQGQASARGKVADLMGTKEYTDANPEEAQALVQALTGGRKLGDRGTEMLKQTYGAKGDVQDNTWKTDAATLLDSRQNARQGQALANAKALVDYKGANNGTGAIPGLGKDRQAQLFKIQTEVANMEKELADNTITAGRRAALESGMKKARIAAEDVVSGNKMNAGSGQGVISTIFGKDAVAAEAPKLIDYTKSAAYRKASPLQRKVLNHPKLNGLVSQNKDGSFSAGGKLLNDVLANQLLGASDL